VKAVLCTAYGPPESLVVRDVPSPPPPGPGDVVISVKAASVNFPDLLIIQNKYQFKPALPVSPGSEAAGVVKAVGANVRHLAVGDRVMAFTTFGAFAEEVTADARGAVPIPLGMDDVTAAAFLVAYGTADHALRDRGRVAAGETILVLGAAGGVGLAAIDVARATGARVIAAASSPGKIAICREQGADATINYADESLRERLRDLTDGRGADVVFDPVGGPYTEPALRSIAWRGRLLVIGFAAGEIPRIPLNLALLKGCSITGVFWGEFVRREPAAFADGMEQLARWYAAGALRPRISATYPLDRAAEALARIAARQVVGKIVLTTQ
jgi:NADPH2:quinone reductase